MVDIVFVGDLLLVEGISHKGKCRVNEHGAIWKVIKVMDNGRCLVESTDGKSYWRWVDAPTDQHFNLLGSVDPDNL